MQPAASARICALCRTGIKIAARMAMMAITTRSSMSVKPFLLIPPPNVPPALRGRGRRSAASLPGIALRFNPSGRLKMSLSVCINELLLVLEPEKLPLTGDGIGHEVFAADRDG